MSTPVLNHQNPFRVLFGTDPNFHKLRVFGCLCYPWLRPYTSHKLQPRSKPCVFVGYSTDHSAYLCLDRLTNRVFVSRHVVFVETEFPFATSVSRMSLQSPTAVDSWCRSPPSVVGSDQETSEQSVTEFPPHHDTVPHDIVPILVSLADPPSLSHPPPPPNLPTQSTPLTIQPLENVQPSASHTVPPASLPLTSQPDQVSPFPARVIQTRSMHNIFKPKPVFDLHVTTHSPPQTEPTSLSQARKHPEWRQAMSVEYDALVRNATWDLVPSQPSQNVVGCKWIFRIKRHSDGSVARYKARLVAKGFHQRPGIDYNETFSPVVKPVTVHLILTIAVTNGWPLRQLDVNNAFLQGTLTDDVYMVQPPDFIHSTKPQHVCKLRKAIYGLRQAPHAWYTELRTFLLASGFTNSTCDASLFLRHRPGNTLYLLVYVDDIIVTGSSDSQVRDFISALALRFSLKDLGLLSFFLGVEAHRSSSGLFLSQQKYTRDLLAKTTMLESKPVSTPLSLAESLKLNDGSAPTDSTQYRQVLGSLQYLSLTRPDVSFAVNKLSQFMHRPTTTHWNAVKRVLRYLKGTLDHGLFLSRSSPLRLHASDDRRSTSAYVVFLGSTPISWCSKKQHTVARSSTEAEYRAIASATAELNWVSHLLHELRFQCPDVPVVYCDNIGATYVCANPIFHSRMKHVAIDFHFVRDQVARNQLRVAHVSTKDQLADSLTKALPRKQFLIHRSKIGILAGSSILRGHISNSSSHEDN
ncbi:hypothetical protein LWI29_036741 [Acer saccharum]|uniref:Reverse transcriptase Ty1/copia-type domain-containing protein n=1 Tax=Acer saccharum TaxID=4024 RepID=A0AA39VS53_ACESA|nr:hypothetical protein LWI29_036741 [Acer saccharum]